MYICNLNRQQADTKLKQLTSHHETTESVSQQEVVEWKNKYEQSKEKAKEYSELVRSLQFKHIKMNIYVHM